MLISVKILKNGYSQSYHELKFTNIVLITYSTINVLFLGFHNGMAGHVF